MLLFCSYFCGMFQIMFPSMTCLLVSVVRGPIYPDPAGRQLQVRRWTECASGITGAAAARA